jgi:hypothetical protein
MEKEERKGGRRELGAGLWMDADSGASVHGKPLTGETGEHTAWCGR